MVKNFISFFFIFLILVSCSNQETKEKQQDDVTETIGTEVEVIAGNLEIPWTITKAGNTFYLSQREGSIIKVNGENGEKEKQEFQSTKEVLHTGEGGLLGFLLAPDFAESKEAYAYHTYQRGDAVLNRVIKVRLTDNRWIEEEVLLEGIPGGRIHNGGRLKIGPDGKLYVTAGDAGEAELAQNLNSLAGKILRINVDGSVPEDNPFPNSFIYSYGHRNPQGLAWDSNGQLYSTEHGQSAHDEINKIEPGKNYGWPIIQGDETAPNMVTPIFQTGNETWAPSGIALRDHTLYIATLRGQKLIAFDLKNLSYKVIYDQVGRLRDVYIENNQIYSITNNRDGRGTPRPNDDTLIRLPFPR